MEPGTTLSAVPGGFSIHIAEATMANVQIADTIHIIIDAGKGVPLSSTIPEPSTYALLGGLGVLGLALWRRRRGKRAGARKSAAAGMGG